MPMFDLRCEMCGHELRDRMEPCECDQVKRGPCPNCGFYNLQRVWLGKPPGAHGDEIDIWIKNGLCHEDGTPKHYTSKEQIFRDAKAKGLINRVEHQGSSGSDKNRHTVRWVSAPVISEEERKRHWHEHEQALQSQS